MKNILSIVLIIVIVLSLTISTLTNVVIFSLIISLYPERAISAPVSVQAASPVSDTVLVDDQVPLSSEPAAAAGPVAYDVGVCIYKFDDNFMTLYRWQIESYFAELETDMVKYNVSIVDSKNSAATQTSQVSDFINQGVDAMIVNLVKPSSAAAITQKAKSAGVPVVYINREPSGPDMLAWDKISYVGADARQSGIYQGEIIAELPDRGDVDGDGTVRYVMIMGDENNSDAEFRTEFSIKALTDAGIQVEKLFEQSGNWDQAKGQELAAAALAQYGAKIDVILCNNDAMALGAYKAILDAGRKVGSDIYLVGVDALDECVQMVEDGKMTGTVFNDHINQAKSAVDATVRYLNGMPVDKYIIVDYQKIT